MGKCIGLATIALDNMPGGIERNVAYLANDLVARGYRVVLLTFDQPGAKAFYILDPRVEWECLGRTPPYTPVTFRQRLELVGRIRAALAAHNVHTLVCFTHGILIRFFLANVFRRMRVVCTERNSLTLYNFIRGRKWNVNFLALFFVDTITVQFPSYIKQYPWLLRGRIRVVHNPVYPAAARKVERPPVILSVGRYATQKRFDVLVRAFALLSDDFPDWTLKIIGDGWLKEQLQRLVAELGLKHRVELASPIAKLDRAFEQATIYCQPSQWEGFPNAQAEAMAAGLIPVGFAATSGVADLIEDRINGALAQGAPTPEAFAEALRRVMSKPEDWPSLSARAAGISKTYSHESWRARWNEILSLEAPSGSGFDGSGSHTMGDTNGQSAP